MSRIYNKIYSTEEWSRVNPVNKDILDDFLSEYRQRRMKKTTLGQYLNHLRKRGDYQ
jgi:hypothetical protein